ncbi:hypothetical protein CYMTET_26491 [Cymbomonas tetramitiformis]|uniref:Uncharacterized protein n=1 Tax=Cymbomonas tetramitiformis TaxID=36881 RepID=A0AAE0KXU9_9CHLO|nr:hypothetical protein CYMTET_26491 [Cymbomonas tetramitiformis]
MEGKKRTAFEADLDFPPPSPDITEPVDVLYFYAEQCTESVAPNSTEEIQELIVEIEERGLPHDADRRRVMFGTLMAWRGVRGKGNRAPHPAWVVDAVRRVWPAERKSATGESKGYMGFKQS